MLLRNKNMPASLMFLWSVWVLLLFVGEKKEYAKISISRALGLFLQVACDCIFNTRLEVSGALRQRGKQSPKNIIGPCLF